MRFVTGKTTYIKLNLFIKKNNWLMYAILLVGWALFQYLVGNRFYGVFIIVFFLTQAVLRRPSFILLAVSVLSIMLFRTSIVDTVQKLKLSNQSVIENPRRSLTNIFSPNKGEGVLPDEVVQMLSLLRVHQIPNYWISNELSKDPLIKQRIIEAAWPIKNEELSHYILKLIEEINQTSNCVTIDQKEDVELVYCH